MAVLTGDRHTPMKDGELISVPVAAAVKIYAGALVVSKGGYAAPGEKAASGIVYLGRAEEHVDNSGGAAGDKSVLVRRGRAFKWANAGGAGAVRQAEVGSAAYILDDQTVTKTATGATKTDPAVVLGVDSDGVWIG